jgi:hypothetical protein
MMHIRKVLENIQMGSEIRSYDPPKKRTTTFGSHE